MTVQCYLIQDCFLYPRWTVWMYLTRLFSRALTPTLNNAVVTSSAGEFPGFSTLVIEIVVRVPDQEIRSCNVYLVTSPAHLTLVSSPWPSLQHGGQWDCVLRGGLEPGDKCYYVLQQLL